MTSPVGPSSVWKGVHRCPFCPYIHVIGIERLTDPAAWYTYRCPLTRLVARFRPMDLTVYVPASESPELATRPGDGGASYITATPE